MHKAIKSVLAKRRLGVVTVRKWLVTGTDSRDGLDHMVEYARTQEEAWAQALAHSEGTRFVPECIYKTSK